MSPAQPTFPRGSTGYTSCNSLRADPLTLTGESQHEGVAVVGLKPESVTTTAMSTGSRLRQGSTFPKLLARAVPSASVKLFRLRECHRSHAAIEVQDHH